MPWFHLHFGGIFIKRNLVSRLGQHVFLVFYFTISSPSSFLVLLILSPYLHIAHLTALLTLPSFHNPHLSTPPPSLAASFIVLH
ncbi:hypothetical protein GDO81_006599 [Engystomops pustulosus]|uniref:Uncharacterized protein n=1 Tax=Engystomops pustulosus TaxID=76066 RepID=A0AAV7CXZ8_ENGPU|nr:hypothetical protein GDO81_006599 [Engystomops pustulosus]